MTLFNSNKHSTNLAGRNWYLPKWLEWIPRLEGEKTPEAPAVPAAGA